MEMGVDTVTGWRAVTGSGLFLVPGFARGSGWRLLKGCGTLNERGVQSVGALRSLLSNGGLGDKCEDVSI